VIELEDVRVMYGRTLALDSISLELVDGVIGLFGQNGSGKSTLLRLIAGFVTPRRGTVRSDGRPIRLGDEAWRRMIGYAGHEPGLYGRLTVRENLELFARLYDADTARASELLHALDVAGRADSRVDSLSAGLKRRVSVARALLHDPTILLLDEPYANLDDDAADRVSEAVKAWRRPGRVALIATHGAKRVKAFAGAAIILKQARVMSYRVRTGAFSSEAVDALETADE
jgi:heme ABC exporter ATP-binding subunit CcmA